MRRHNQQKEQQRHQQYNHLFSFQIFFFFASPFGRVIRELIFSHLFRSFKCDVSNFFRHNLKKVSPSFRRFFSRWNKFLSFGHVLVMRCGTNGWMNRMKECNEWMENAEKLQTQTTKPLTYSIIIIAVTVVECQTLCAICAEGEKKKRTKSVFTNKPKMKYVWTYTNT